MAAKSTRRNRPIEQSIVSGMTVLGFRWRSIVFVGLGLILARALLTHFSPHWEQEEDAEDSAS